MRFRHPSFLGILFYLIVLFPVWAFFYDVFNMQTSVYSANFFLMGLNPNNIGGAATGAGYYIYLYDMLQLGLYRVSGYNDLITAMLLKIIFLVLLYFAAVVSMRLLENAGRKHSDVVFYSIAYNPFFLFIIMIGPYTSLVIAFLLIIGIYEIGKGGFHRIVGYILILLASAWYIYPIFLIPALILDSSGGGGSSPRQAVIPFLVSIGVFLPSIYLFLSNILKVTSTAGGENVVPYSIFFLIAASNSDVAMYNKILPFLLVALTLIVTFALRMYRVDRYITYFALLVLTLLLQTGNVSADYYTMTIPFLVIGISRSINKPSYGKTLLAELFILPQMYILNLRNGIDGYSGFFYWGYYIFKKPSPSGYFQILGGLLAWRISLLLTLVLLIPVISLLLYISKSSSEQRRIGSPPVSSTIFVSQRRLIAAGIAIFVMAASIATPVFVHMEQNYQGHGGINSSVFQSGAYPDYQWIPPGSGFQVSDAGSHLLFPSYSSMVGIYRNISKQGVDLKIAMNPGLPENTSFGDFTVIKTNSLSYGYLYTLNFSNGTFLAPSSSLNVSKSPSSSIPFVDAPPIVYNLLGSGYMQYNVSYDQVHNKTIMFGSKIIKSNDRINVLFALFNGGTSILVGTHMFSNGIFQLIFELYHDGKYNYTSMATTLSLGAWIPVTIQGTGNGGILVGVANYQHLFPGALNRNYITSLILGMASPCVACKRNSFSLNGEVTGLYAVNGSNVLSLLTFVNSTSGDYYFPRAIRDLSLDIGSSSSSITADGVTVRFLGQSTYLWIGKLFNASETLSVSINSIKIFSLAGSTINYYYAVLLLPLYTIMIVVEISLINSSRVARRVRFS